jgi:tetratricopeptide (TPR) repeat protein
VAERVKAFKNRGRGSFNRKDYDRAIADYGEAIKLSPKDASAFAHRCEAYESKEDHDAAICKQGKCRNWHEVDVWQGDHTLAQKFYFVSDLHVVLPCDGQQKWSGLESWQ